MATAFGSDEWVAAADEPYGYLDSETLKRLDIQPVQDDEVAAIAAASAPGVKAAFTRTQLLKGTLPLSPFARMASNSSDPKRGGDVIVLLDPYALPITGSERTTHGSPWSYDSQVPLVLWGSAFRPGGLLQPLPANRPCPNLGCNPRINPALGDSRQAACGGHKIAERCLALTYLLKAAQGCFGFLGHSSLRIAWSY